MTQCQLSEKNSGSDHILATIGMARPTGAIRGRCRHGKHVGLAAHRLLWGGHGRATYLAPLVSCRRNQSLTTT